MSDSKLSDRLFFWDNAKGILIALVVLGHMLLGYLYHNDIALFTLGIYIFHMPAFAFASGYLSVKKTSPLISSISFLLIAYVFFNFLAAFYFYFVHGFSFSLFEPYVSFWYILALIAWRLLLCVVPKKMSVIVLSFLIALIVGFSDQFTNVMAISRIICFFPFFLLGAWMPWSKWVAFLKSNRRLSFLLGIFFLTAAVAGSIFLLSGFVDFDEFLMFPYAASGAFLRRIVIIVLSLLFIGSGLLLIPHKPVPFLSQWGRYSLSIFLFHRFVTLVIPEAFPLAHDSLLAWLVSIVSSFIILIVFGNATAHKFLNRAINGLMSRLSYPSDGKTDGCFSRRNFLYRTLVVIVIFGIVLFSIFSTLPPPVKASADILPVYDVLSAEDQARLDNTICISFVGDLILLRNQVFAAYDEDLDEFDFSDMFEYASPYLDADLSIGIFEGPMGGPDKGFSTGDYDDGLPVYLNFPDAFGAAVRDSGINMVSYANNHILDMGLDAAMRTLDIFDDLGLMHTGVYRNQEEKDVPLIVDVDGVRVGILSYTFRSNYFSDDYFLFENPSLTRLIVDPRSPHFDMVEAQVRADFDLLRSAEPDLIVVIPHMGTQFIHETDFFQDTWNDIFVDAGADVILGDHSHAVQPIEFVDTAREDGSSRTTIIVNCPGNFANSYVDYNGDATAIARVYIDRDSFEPIAASIVPMWTHGSSSGFFRALPIYEVFSNDALFAQMSYTDLERISDVQELVTEVMIGTSVPLDQLQDEYFLFSDGYRRQPLPALDLSDFSLDSDHMRLIDEADSIFFLGDSLTAGSNNGGYPWFEPLMASFPSKSFDSFAFGGATSVTLLEHYDVLSAIDADVVVVAVGANDIRYRNEDICAMTAEEYVDRLHQMVSVVRSTNSSAQFVFIAPWPALLNDPFTPLVMRDKVMLYQDYTAALMAFCIEYGHVFVDPTDGIIERLLEEPVSQYFLDHIHPNAVNGVALVSASFVGYDGERQGLYEYLFLTDLTEQ